MLYKHWIQKHLLYRHARNNFHMDRKMEAKPPFCHYTKYFEGLARIVHIELYRMRGHAHPLHFLRLQFDVGVNHAIAENTTVRQEFAIFI